eukprot:8827290-Alexandrium_andersonii.AAC.1
MCAPHHHRAHAPPCAKPTIIEVIKTQMNCTVRSHQDGRGSLDGQGNLFSPSIDASVLLLATVLLVIRP